MGPKVLVVDDYLEISESLASILMDIGYDVVDIAQNGHEAFEMYQKYSPDVVLMDVIMPESSGIESILKIRKYDTDAKIIFITADMSQKTELDMIENNATAIIYKPYEINKVIDTINDAYSGTLELSL